MFCHQGLTLTNYRVTLFRTLGIMYYQRLTRAYRPICSPGLFEINLKSQKPPALETTVSGSAPLCPAPHVQPPLSSSSHPAPLFQLLTSSSPLPAPLFQLFHLQILPWPPRIIKSMPVGKHNNSCQSLDGVAGHRHK